MDVAPRSAEERARTFQAQAEVYLEKAQAEPLLQRQQVLLMAARRCERLAEAERRVIGLRRRAPS